VAAPHTQAAAAPHGAQPPQRGAGDHPMGPQPRRRWM